MKSLIKQVFATIGLLILLTGQAFASSSVTFYHHDALGSVVAATDQAGAIVWQEEYQPYGGKITPVSTDDQTGNSDWYTGKSYNESLDLTYFGARWYDAKQGRFLSIDPAPVTIENIHSFNRYHYANNNPYKYVDPDGEFAITALVVLSVAISTYMTGDNAIGAYEAEASVLDDGVSVNGLKAAGKSLAVDAITSLAVAGVLYPVRFLGSGARSGVQANKVAGDAARDVIAARTGGIIEQNFRVTGGLRRVDVLVGTAAIESKVGKTSLSGRVRQELARDVKLLRSGQVDRVRWEFSTSGVTGKGGPTGPLRRKLEKFGIDIVE
jgi:RHS repeat-associated protein